MVNNFTNLRSPENHPNFIRRIWQLIYSPRRFFITPGWSGDFWVPLIIVTLALAGLRLVQLPEVEKQFDDPKFKTLIAKQRKITEDEATRLIEKMRRAAPMLSVLESPVVVAAGTAGLALLLYLIGRIVFRQTIPYTVVFSLTAWTSLISAIPLSLHILLYTINPQWSLPSSPTYFFPEAWRSHYFAKVAMVLDVFLIWQVALLCLGISYLYKITLYRSISAVGTLFVCFAILNALFAKL